MELKIDIEDFQQVVSKPAGRAVEKAIVRAANRTAPSVRMFAQKEITGQFGVKRKPIVDRVGLLKATSSVKYSRLSFSRLRNLPRVYFGARAKKVKTAAGPRIGVTAMVKGTRQQIPGAFLATMPNGKIGVFERKTTKRKPIRQLFGTEVRDLFENNPTFLGSLRGHSNEVFAKNFEADFKYYMSKEVVAE